MASGFGLTNQLTVKQPTPQSHPQSINNYWLIYCYFGLYLGEWKAQDCLLLLWSSYPTITATRGSLNWCGSYADCHDFFVSLLSPAKVSISISNTHTHTHTHTLRLVFIMSLSSKWELTHSFQGKSLLRNYKSLTNFSAKFRIFGIIDILSAAQSDNRSVICYIVLFPLLQTQVGIERWLRVRHFRVGMMINDHLISH